MHQNKGANESPTIDTAKLKLNTKKDLGPKKLNPGKTDCGDCAGCRKTSNCQDCKFCLKPSLKKKCEKRMCDKKKISNQSMVVNKGPESTNSTSEAEENIEPDQNMPFKCNKCGKAFKFIKWLINHKKKDECLKKKLKHCAVCDKLVGSDYFKKHAQTHKAAMLKCDKCKGLFKSTETLQAHKDSIHKPKCDSKTALKSDVCVRVFKHKSILKQHVSKNYTINDQKH